MELILFFPPKVNLTCILNVNKVKRELLEICEVASITVKTRSGDWEERGKSQMRKSQE